MSRLLVVLHVFYHDQVDYFIDKLANISDCEWDLTVTWSEFSQESYDKLKAFKPDLTVQLVSNAGYDVWPFIQVIRNTDFSRYDYVLKLHTKRFMTKSMRIEGLKMEKWFWRDALLNPILKSKERFSRCLSIMDSNPKVGYICSYEFHMNLEDMLPEDEMLLRQEADRISMENFDKGRFCAGTMFLARIQALQKLKEIEFTDEMWNFKQKSGASGTLAHVYERMLCLLMRDAGYRAKAIPHSKRKSSKVFYRRNLYPVIKNVFTLSRCSKTDQKYMIILGRRFNLSALDKRRSSVRNK